MDSNPPSAQLRLSASPNQKGGKIEASPKKSNLETPPYVSHHGRHSFPVKIQPKEAAQVPVSLIKKSPGKRSELSPAHQAQLLPQTKSETNVMTKKILTNAETIANQSLAHLKDIQLAHNSDIERLTNENRILKARLEELINFSEIEKNNYELEKEMDQSQMRKQQMDILELTQKLERLQKEANDLDSIQEVRKAENELLKQEMLELTERMKKYQTEIHQQSLQDIIENEEPITKETKMVNTTEITKTINDTIENNERILKNTETQVDILIERMKIVSKRIQPIKNSLISIKNDSEKLKIENSTQNDCERSLLEELKTQNTTLESELTKLEAALAEEQLEKEENIKKIELLKTDHEIQIVNLEQIHFKNQEKIINEYEEKFNLLKMESNTQIEKKNADHISEIDSLKLQYQSEIETNKNKNIEDLQDLEKKYYNIWMKLKQYTQNYDNLNEQLLQERKTHSKSLAELEKSYKELEEKYRTVSDNYQEALQEWNTKENIYKNQIDTLQEKITNFHADSDKINTENYQTTVVVEKDITQEKEYLDLEKEKNDQIDILKSTLNEYSQQISDLQLVKEQNDELSNQMELLDEEKKNAVFIKSKLEKEKANLERKVATLEEQIKTLENEIQFLKNNNDKLNELLDNEKSVIELKNTEINTYIQQLKEKSLENEHFQEKLIIKAEQDEIIMESAKKSQAFPAEEDSAEIQELRTQLQSAIQEKEKIMQNEATRYEKLKKEISDMAKEQQALTDELLKAQNELANRPVICEEMKKSTEEKSPCQERSPRKSKKKIDKGTAIQIQEMRKTNLTLGKQVAELQSSSFKYKVTTYCTIGFLVFMILLWFNNLSFNTS